MSPALCAARLAGTKEEQLPLWVSATNVGGLQAIRMMVKMPYARCAARLAGTQREQLPLWGSAESAGGLQAIRMMGAESAKHKKRRVEQELV